jgi:hypothetical protein
MAPSAGTGTAPDLTRFEWGESVGGLRLGIRSSSNSLSAGTAVELYLAAHNASARTTAIGDEVVLLVRSDDSITEHAGGPRSTTPIPLAPGEVLELFAWRLDGTTALDVGQHQCWVAYRPGGGGATPDLVSGVATVRVTKD